MAVLTPWLRITVDFGRLRAILAGLPIRTSLACPRAPDIQQCRVLGRSDSGPSSASEASPSVAPMLVIASAEDVAFITGAATVLAALVLGGFAAVAAERRLTKQTKEAGDRQARELAEAADRQRRELTDAAERQRRELDAEAARQRAALAHDRELADLQDLRRLLDEAAVALNTAEEARVGLELRFAEHGRKVSPELLSEAREAGRAMFALRERLYVRVGRDHPIAQSFNRATVALLLIWQAVGRLEADDDATAVQESRSTIASARHSFEEGFSGFTEAAVERAGTVPTEAV